MPENKQQDTLKKMLEIGDLIEQGRENEDTSRNYQLL